MQILKRQPLAAGKLMPLLVPTEAWQVVSMDRITHLPKTKQGHTTICVVVDKLAKTCHLTLCKDTNGAEASTMLLRTTAVGLLAGQVAGWLAK